MMIPCVWIPEETASRKRRSNMPHMQPILSLIAGILILIMPRLLNYIVAVYLIVYGILGLAR
jgi:uncharacterized membrane protein YdbT with pleckstrin-like domain